MSSESLVTADPIWGLGDEYEPDLKCFLVPKWKDLRRKLENYSRIHNEFSHERFCEAYSAALHEVSKEPHLIVQIPALENWRERTNSHFYGFEFKGKKYDGIIEIILEYFEEPYNPFDSDIFKEIEDYCLSFLEEKKIHVMNFAHGLYQYITTHIGIGSPEPIPSLIIEEAGRNVTNCKNELIDGLLDIQKKQEIARQDVAGEKPLKPMPVWSVQGFSQTQIGKWFSVNYEADEKKYRARCRDFKARYPKLTESIEGTRNLRVDYRMLDYIRKKEKITPIEWPNYNIS